MPRLSRRSLIAGAAAFAAARPAVAQGPGLVTYKTFTGAEIQVRPFVGRNIALLLSPRRSTEPATISRLVATIDRAWDWYRGHLGKSPTPFKTHEGKATIVENEQDPAASARGYLGHTGIEIGLSSMNRLITEAAGDRYNQAVFYELGRNFWFFEEQLGRMQAPVVGGVFTTGFATVHRFYAMEAAGAVGAPWDDELDFDGFRHISLIDVLDRYLADPALTWKTTLAVNKAPAGLPSWVAGYHLAAAFFHRIRRDHGFGGARRFWQLMAGAPKATTAEESAARFVQVARAATGEDYRPLLRDMTLPL